jgi:hypothetical protein
MSKQYEVGLRNITREMKATIKGNRQELYALEEREGVEGTSSGLEHDIAFLEGRISGQRAFLAILEGRQT